MKNDPEQHRFFDRFMHWAEGERPNQDHEVAEDPERAEFMEYLEYLDSHEHMDFGAYRLMRYREREAKGIPHPVATHHSHIRVEEAVSAQRPRYRFGHFRRMIWVYRVLSVLVAAVLMVTLFAVTLQLPAFGDPNAPANNEVAQRYLDQGVEETGAVNAVAGMILDYRAFDTFGESTVLFAASMSVILLLRKPNAQAAEKTESWDRILAQMGQLILPAVLMLGIYVVLNGHISPGGGFSGGTVLGCAFILGALSLGRERMDQLLSPARVTRLTVGCLLAYGLMKSYSFLTGANHTGWEIPEGTPGAIFSAGLILPLNICVGVIVACTMYTFYTLFAGKEA